MFHVIAYHPGLRVCCSYPDRATATRAFESATRATLGVTGSRVQLLDDDNFLISEGPYPEWDLAARLAELPPRDEDDPEYQPSPELIAEIHAIWTTPI